GVAVSGAGALDGLVGHAGNGRRGVIFHRHLLTALRRIAAGIRRLPGARDVEGVAAVPGGVGQGARDGDGRTAASVAGGRRVEGPGDATLNDLVAHAGNGRRGVIFDRHLLTALRRIAAGIRCPPGARDV